MISASPCCIKYCCTQAVIKQVCLTKALYRIICQVHALPRVGDGRHLAAVECFPRGFGADQPLSPPIYNFPIGGQRQDFKFKSSQGKDCIFLCSICGGRDKKVQSLLLSLATLGVCRGKKAAQSPGLPFLRRTDCFSVTRNVISFLSLLSTFWRAGAGSGGCFFSRLVLLGAADLQAGRDVPLPPVPPPCPPSSLDGDPPPTTMRTSHRSHLPGVPPERPPAPSSKTLPGGSGSGGPASSCPQYVMQVSAKDGQLLSSVVRTLTTQRYVGGGGMGQDGMGPFPAWARVHPPQLPPASPAGA